MKKVDVIVVGDARIHTYLIGHRAIHENRKWVFQKTDREYEWGEGCRSPLVKRGVQSLV
jgi:hypothetical protein